MAEDHLTRPISPYAIGKLTIENYLRYFRAAKGLEYTAFRISNPYGPRQPRNRTQGLIPIVLRRFAGGQPALRFGDGSMIRDYIFVEDLMARIVSAVGVPNGSQIYNLGSGVGHTLNDVLTTIETVIGTPLDIVETAVPQAFVSRVVLDTSRFESEFGAMPLMPLAAQRRWRAVGVENMGRVAFQSLAR